MRSEDIAKHIIALIGGEEGLKRMKVQGVEVVPLGVQFVVHRDNPGDITVKVTLSASCYDVQVSGAPLMFAQHQLEGLQEWQLVDVLKVLEWFAK